LRLESTLLPFFEPELRDLEGASLESLGITRREAEVLTWVSLGKTNFEIAKILGLSVRTVEKHVEHILQKLAVETRTAAARLRETLLAKPTALPPE
jgi:DNA-binding CsgD family transcriptional regulator